MVVGGIIGPNSQGPEELLAGPATTTEELLVADVKLSSAGDVHGNKVKASAARHRWLFHELSREMAKL